MLQRHLRERLTHDSHVLDYVTACLSGKMDLTPLAVCNKCTHTVSVPHTQTSFSPNTHSLRHRGSHMEVLDAHGAAPHRHAGVAHTHTGDSVTWNSVCHRGSHMLQVHSVSHLEQCLPHSVTHTSGTLSVSPGTVSVTQCHTRFRHTQCLTWCLLLTHTGVLLSQTQ